MENHHESGESGDQGRSVPSENQLVIENQPLLGHCGGTSSRSMPVYKSTGDNELDNHVNTHDDAGDDDDANSFVPWQERLAEIWVQSKGMVFVVLAQMFGASMNIMTQVLEVDGSHGRAMHPFQILFTRMSITVVASYLYMWYARVPNPLGTRPVLKLLVIRAVSGFFGVYGLYYSVQYLALSEATVLTFLAPILSCYVCSFLIPGETFSRKQQLAGVVSLLGVVMIARPFPLFGSTPPPAQGEPSSGPVPNGKEDGQHPISADTYHHLLAIIAALIGVFGATGAYVAIRMIGRRAHPLVSVTYFSAWSMLLSTVAMVAIPSIPFRLPANMLEWGLLFGLGICGFILQFLLTAGLAYVPPPPTVTTSSRRRSQSTQTTEQVNRKSSGYGSRATFMVYTQMLFAVVYDRVIWGSTLSPMSWMGSALILGSAIYVGVVRDGGSGGTQGSTAESCKDSNDHIADEEEGQAVEEQGTGEVRR